MALITFEGIEGCGKTTQIEMLKKSLHEAGVQNVPVTSEPGWNKQISGIMKYLISEGDTSPLEKLFLFLADRTSHYEKFIKPIHESGVGYNDHPAGKIILSERGPDSTLAYQGYGAKLAPFQWLVEANKMATNNFPIDLTILLDMPPEDSLDRVGKKDNISKYGSEFYYGVRQGYSILSKQDPARIVVVNAAWPKDEVHAHIWEIVSTRLGL